MTTDGDDGQLQWETPFPIRRADLEQLLLTINGPAVAALDFPFGLPSDFAITQGFVRWGEGLMDSCDRMSTTDQAEFKEVAREYVAAYGEPRRASDVPPAFSPLHATNPNMVPMTHHGMAMLGRLLRRAPGRFKIPPLPANAVRGQVTLVELMPGQLLPRPRRFRASATRTARTTSPAATRSSPASKSGSTPRSLNTSAWPAAPTPTASMPQST